MTLCDAGPLFALVDPRQAVLHQRCKAALSHLRSPLVTTWPSFTEAMYLAHPSAGWSHFRGTLHLRAAKGWQGDGIKT